MRYVFDQVSLHERFNVISQHYLHIVLPMCTVRPMLADAVPIELIDTSQVLKEVDSLYKVANGVPGQLVDKNTTVTRT